MEEKWGSLHREHLEKLFPQDLIHCRKKEDQREEGEKKEGKGVRTSEKAVGVEMRERDVVSVASSS